MGFEPVNTVCLFPGPSMEYPAPFPMIRVAENEVQDWIAKGWSLTAPVSPEEAPDEKPKGKAKK